MFMYGYCSHWTGWKYSTNNYIVIVYKFVTTWKYLSTELKESLHWKVVLKLCIYLCEDSTEFDTKNVCKYKWL